MTNTIITNCSEKKQGRHISLVHIKKKRGPRTQTLTAEPRATCPTWSDPCHASLWLLWGRMLPNYFVTKFKTGTKSWQSGLSESKNTVCGTTVGSPAGLWTLPATILEKAIKGSFKGPTLYPFFDLYFGLQWSRFTWFNFLTKKKLIIVKMTKNCV